MLDPYFKLDHLAVWNEHLPQLKEDESTLVKADGALDKMHSDHNRLLFDADSLALARDATQLAGLYRQQAQGERAQRLAKVAHLKQQNAIGGSICTKFMEERSKHIAGPLSDLKDAIGKDTRVKLANEHQTKPNQTQTRKE